MPSPNSLWRYDLNFCSLSMISHQPQCIIICATRSLTDLFLTCQWINPTSSKSQNHYKTVDVSPAIVSSLKSSDQPRLVEQWRVFITSEKVTPTQAKISCTLFNALLNTPYNKNALFLCVSCWCVNDFSPLYLLITSVFSCHKTLLQLPNAFVVM